MYKKKSANITMTVLKIGLVLTIALLLIGIFSPFLNEKAKGIIDFFKSQTNIDKKIDAKEYVSKEFKDNAFAFIYIEGRYGEDDFLSKLTSFKLYEEFEKYLKHPSFAKYNPTKKRGASLKDYPNFLSPDYCWIFSIELKGDDSRATSYYDSTILTKLDYSSLNYEEHKERCNKIDNVICNHDALDIIDKFELYLSVSQYPGNHVDYSYGENWLCGKQKPGPKVWFLCNSNVTETLDLYLEEQEEFESYECKCINDGKKCRWIHKGT